MENGLADLLDSSSGDHQLGRHIHQERHPLQRRGEKETVSLVAVADESQMTEYFTFRTGRATRPLP